MPYSKEGRLIVLTEEIACDLELRLVTAPVPITPDTLFAGLTEPGFTGYAPIVPVFDAPILDGGGYAYSLADGPFTWTVTADGAQFLIRAVVLLIDNGTGWKILDFINLTAAVVMEDNGNAMSVSKWELWQGTPVPIP